MFSYKFFLFLVALDFFIFIAWLKSDKVKRNSVISWFITAASGLVIFIMECLYHLSIGCPLFVECYLPGWENEIHFGALMFFWAFILMPLSIYKIISIFRKILVTN